MNSDAFDKGPRSLGVIAFTGGALLTLLGVLAHSAMFMMTSCVAQGPQVTGHRDSAMQKPADEINVLMKKARGGDKDAAWTVFLHYSLGLRDKEAAEPWLRLADKLGNPKAKHYYQVRRTAQGEE